MRHSGLRRGNCGSGVCRESARLYAGCGCFCSLPPCGGGSGRGVPHDVLLQFARRRHALDLVEGALPSSTFSRATPLPSPPPEGGRERFARAHGSEHAHWSRTAVPRMTALPALIQRDIKIALRVGGGALIGVLFFLTVVVLMPFAVGPDLALLARLGPAILWLGALLASLLTLDRLFTADHEDGSLDLIVMSRPPL